MNKSLLRNQPAPNSGPGRKRLALVCICLLSALPLACNKKSGPPANGNTQPTGDASALGVEQIIERYRAVDNSRDSTMKLRAKIEEADASEASSHPGEVQLTISRKRASDGRVLILVEFTSPAQERDRSALVTISPAGEIEGTRFVQSNGAFVSTTGVTSEDSLFGMTLQELADGQPEKYNHRLIGEEAVDGRAVYHIEGKLKPGAESKFPRLILLISKESFAPLVAEFYDNQDQMVRRLSVEKIEQVEGHWTRKNWTVDNRARKKKIAFETTGAKYDQNLPDSLFTREHLKQISSK